MVNNVIRFIVDANGNLLEQPQGRFRANNNTVDKVQFIAPFDITDSVSMTFTKPSFPDLTQYNVITTYKGADVVEETNPLYQDVAEYNVWEVGVKDTILNFISKYRNTDIKVSFQIGSIEPNSKCLSFEGYFGVDSDLPTTGQTTGDYYACEDIEFVMADNGNGRSYTFGKGMYVYWNGSYWVKVRLSVKQNVNATDIPVEANAGQGYELEEDEVNYLEGIASTGVSNETRITALEDTQEDIISGEQEIDKINWNMDAVNENDLEIGESAYIDGILKTRLNDSVVLSHGEEQLRARRNNTGATLNDFVPVYVTGAVGQRVTVALAGTGVTDILSKQIEVMTQDLDNNSNGYSNKSGEVKRTNTTGSQFGETWNDGDVIYLGATAGTMTNVEPTAPTPKIRLGHVVYAHGVNGVFEVDVCIAHNLGDLSNVDLTGAQEGDTLKRNALGVYVTDTRVSDHETRIGTLETFATSGLIYKGQSTYEDLPTSDQKVGDLYNITNDFEDGGEDYKAGTNAIWNGASWDFSASEIPNTEEIEVSSPSTESPSGTASTQKEVNEEVTENVKENSVNISKNQKTIKELEENIRKSNNGETTNEVSGTDIISLGNDVANAPLTPLLKGISLDSVTFNKRIRSVGKNLFDGELELGNISTTDGLNSSATDRIRSSNYTKVSPETDYVISLGSGSYILGMRYYQNDKTYISSEAKNDGTYFTTPLNCNYVRFIVLSNTNIQEEVIFEYGQTTSDYEPYASSDMYIQANEEGYCYMGTCDSIEIKNGQPYFIKRVNDTLDGLESPYIETPIISSGVLNGYNNGTVYVDDIVVDYDEYTTQFDITNTNYPIDSLEKIEKYSNGIWESLDIEDATIAVDGLSFTHTELSSGDLIYIEYKPQGNYVDGLTTITYYDNKYVVVDSVTSTVYRWSISSANGVASIDLEEV